jgi:hypothetical protein
LQLPVPDPVQHAAGSELLVQELFPSPELQIPAPDPVQQERGVPFAVQIAFVPPQ